MSGFATKLRTRIVPLLVTIGATALAGMLGLKAWHYYMSAPWTRDGVVRAYVVKIAPEVSGRIVELPVVDNQFVHKGDLLVVINPTNYVIAVKLAEAAVARAEANARNKQTESLRRQKLTTLAASIEEKQTYESAALESEANLKLAMANLDRARADLDRTHIKSPVNGHVTNLIAQLGDYANVGQLQISLIDEDSFWIDAYFPETKLDRIPEGAPVSIKLLAYRQVLQGHVDSVAGGITVSNAQPDSSGLASVNPIFTWVRLAQRVPVRVRIDNVPNNIRLVAGMTANVQVDPTVHN
jgi:multidrug resistance efflux pump